MSATSIAGFASLPERVRAFIALRLDAGVDDAIAELTERLRAADNNLRRDDTQERGIRWVQRANFHLTLFFLGPAVARDRLAPIADALEVIAKQTGTFEVAARGVGVFPNPARPRVIWVGLDCTGPDGGALAALAARVAEAAGRCGFAPERRTYSPHMTIGRVRSLRAPGRLWRTLSAEADSNFGVSRIERMMLFRSEPGPQSSTYHELAAFPFGAGERG